MSGAGSDAQVNSAWQQYATAETRQRFLGDQQMRGVLEGTPDARGAPRLLNFTLTPDQLAPGPAHDKLLKELETRRDSVNQLNSSLDDTQRPLKKVFTTAFGAKDGETYFNNFQNYAAQQTNKSPVEVGRIQAGDVKKAVFGENNPNPRANEIAQRLAGPVNPNGGDARIFDSSVKTTSDALKRANTTEVFKQQHLAGLDRVIDTVKKSDPADADRNTGEISGLAQQGNIEKAKIAAPAIDVTTGVEQNQLKTPSVSTQTAPITGTPVTNGSGSGNFESFAEPQKTAPTATVGVSGLNTGVKIANAVGLAGAAVGVADKVTKGDYKGAAVEGAATVGTGVVVAAAERFVPVAGPVLAAGSAAVDTYNAAKAGKTGEAVTSGVEATLYSISAGAGLVAAGTIAAPPVAAAAGTVAAVAGGAALVVTAGKAVYNNFDKVKGWFASHVDNTTTANTDTAPVPNKAPESKDKAADSTKSGNKDKPDAADAVPIAPSGISRAAALRTVAQDPAPNPATDEPPKKAEVKPTAPQQPKRYAQLGMGGP